MSGAFGPFAFGASGFGEGAGPNVATTSGTFSFSPPIADILVEAYERCGKTVVALNIEQIRTGRRSLNLVLSAWANKGVNLWTVAQFTQYMPRGVSQYLVPPQVIDVLADSVVVRQYLMGAPTSVAPSFVTQIGSSVVTVSGLPQTPSAGQYITIGVAVAVGGLILNGFYQVVSVPGSGEATIIANGVSTGSASVVVPLDSAGNIMLDSAGNPLYPSGPSAGGGVVPQFASTANSRTMTVTFPGNGLLIGQPFNVEVTTVVGGVSLLGPYPVASVLSADQFTITAPYPAGSAQTVFENGGDTLLSTQSTTDGLIQYSNPTDIEMYPLSRGDYAVIPQKFQQGRPTSYWLNRQISPVFNIWPTPDQNGPYELRYWASQQVQDAYIENGQTINMPYRMFEAFVAAVAGHLAMKIAQPLAKDLMAYAALVWQEASDEDRERVSSFLSPDFSGYFS